MAFVTSSWILDILFVIGTALFTYYLKFRFHSRFYWKNRNIPYFEPTFIVGNTPELNRTKNLVQLVNGIYEKAKEHKLFGIWSYFQPMLIVQDPVLIKNVLVKDFQYFHDRSIHVNEEHDPLDAHLVFANGSKWRNLRVKLSPVFTSGKIKMMYPTMKTCGEELQNYLARHAEKNEVVEMKDVLARFTTDIIGSVAFGIETNTLKNPDSEFRKFGKRIFSPSPTVVFVSLLLFLFPKLGDWFPLKRIDSDVEKFFLDTVKETIEYRRKNNVRRKDFMDLLIQLMDKGYVEDVDRKNDPNSTGDKFTFNQAAAQAFVFFSAGFDTSTATMMWTLFELAKSPKVQKKLQEEIDTVVRKHGDITYDAIQDMEYLDWAVNESLRMHPPFGILFRECTNDYEVPELGARIDKGTAIFIPVEGIQNDERYFPNPKVFRPERFSPEEKAGRDTYLHLPFGEGPRICIGNRFGLLQSKVGLFYVLSKYNVQLAECMKGPVKIDMKDFIPTPIGGMQLKLSKRNSD